MFHRNIFPDCIIYLCSIHVYRYTREKVLPSSKMTDGSEVEKVKIINQFKLVRDAHTEEQYANRREELFEMTEGLLVKPGNTKNFVLFHDYFNRNWDGVKEMCFFCYMKQYPTLVRFFILGNVQILLAFIFQLNVQ